jgi:hypothetical protein
MGVSDSLTDHATEFWLKLWGGFWKTSSKRKNKFTLYLAPFAATIITMSDHEGEHHVLRVIKKEDRGS